MRNVVVISMFFLLYFPVKAQETITNNHFFLNPYVYNPAFAGKEGRGNLSLNHRQQWRGIEGAPITSIVTFDIPLVNNLNIGVKFINDQKSILNNTTGFLTLGYTVPFSSDRKHALSFGLSAGVMKQVVDSDESYNLNDPAVVGLFNSSTHLLGEFGVYYRCNNLNVGIALPTLFNAQYANEKIAFDPFDETLFMASYAFVLSERKLVFEPYLLYRMREKASGQFEATGILRFYEAFWVGGVFRQGYGPSTLLGVNIGDNVSLGYAYELASSQVNGYANGSHEIQLSIGLGDRNKKPKPRNPRYKF